MEEKDTAGGPKVNSFGGRFGACTLDLSTRAAVSLSLRYISIVYTDLIRIMTAHKRSGENSGERKSGAKHTAAAAGHRKCISYIKKKPAAKQ